MVRLRAFLSLLTCLLGAGSCANAPEPKPRPATGVNEVIVMGMIHDGHRTSATYSLAVVRQMLEAMDPDYILAEIPPTRVAIAAREFAADGTIKERRVRVFPEYTDVVFPLTRTHRFQIIGCAAWTQAMADDRRRKLNAFKTARPEQHKQVADARAGIGKAPRDPRGIHSDAYDAIVEQGMAPYNRLWNQDLGDGGWDNINAAHYKLIARALDAHRGEGRRFVIMFGAWHKHWFLKELRKRDDIVLRNAADFFESDQ